VKSNVQFLRFRFPTAFQVRASRINTTTYLLSFNSISYCDAAIQLFIQNNRELKQENDKRLKQLEEKNLSDATKMVKEHLDRIAQHNYVPINDKRYGCKMCESLPTYYDDFKAIRKGPERLRIYHSNPNYQKEMDEYKGGLRPEEPRRKTVCYIDPRELSPAIRAKLHKEGKVLLYK
jgi:hypothetical protein